MNRYWNGHQWRDLPAGETAGDGSAADRGLATDGLGAATASAPSATAPIGTVGPVETAAPIGTVGPVKPAGTNALIAPLVVAPAPGVGKKAITVAAVPIATHAEYGDVFTAVAENSQVCP